MNKENVDKVKDWILDTQQNLQYILLLGDFHNIDNLDVVPKDETIQLQEIKDLLQPLTDLNILCYMIPGNHDTPSMFKDETYQFGQNIVNIHNKIINLSDDLQIVAFGGSVPGYLNGVLHWNGYPFQNNEDYGVDFQHLNQEYQCKQEKQTILMTHCGPSISSTTVSYEGTNVIQSGSTYLSDFLHDNTNNILMNIHGHTHDGYGYRRINNLNIINAGPLLYGKYTVIDLIKQNVRWEIKNIKLMSV